MQREGEEGREDIGMRDGRERKRKGREMSLPRSFLKFGAYDGYTSVMTFNKKLKIYLLEQCQQQTLQKSGFFCLLFIF